MSEVTELTDEQKKAVNDLAQRHEMGGYCGTAFILDQRVINFGQACYAAGRLSTQGAGPRCPECGSDKVEFGFSFDFGNAMGAYIACFGSCNGRREPARNLRDFAQFFRAPSDPPRLEARKPEPLGFCIGARCPGCAQCDK